MNRTFDFYEYAGIIVPGAVLLLGLIWLLPEGRAFFSKEGVTFGELGLFVIVAYAAGQLVQGIGNAIEWTWWKLCAGLPSTRALASGAYLSADQHRRLLAAVRADFGTTDAELAKPPSFSPFPVVREIYSAVSEAKRAARVDTFVGNYGLARGLAAALLILIVLTIATTKGLVAVGVLVLLSCSLSSGCTALAATMRPSSSSSSSRSKRLKNHLIELESDRSVATPESPHHVFGSNGLDVACLAGPARRPTLYM